MPASAVTKPPSLHAKAPALGAIPGYFIQPARLLRAYQRQHLRPDLIAGVTVGVVSLPQGIAFALLAGLPAEMGIYTSIIAAVVGALWGSSNQLSTGPTNSSSLLVFSVLLPIALPGSPAYIAAAGLLAVMAGALRVVMGMARLGVLINFVSDSVIVGFTAGAGVLIIVGQLRTLFGLDFPSSPRLIETVANVGRHIQELHWLSALLGIGTIVAAILIRRFRRNLPAPLIAMGLAGVVVAIFDLPQYGVAVLSSLTRSLPPLTDLSQLSFRMISDLSPGALALAVIGLIEAMSIARAIAAQTGQRLDSNQEFVGQGLANIAAGMLSGYPSSGSFNRSALNLEAGARTPLASLFSGLVVLVIVFLFAPLAVYVPLPAIAALLVLSAFSMINRKEMVRIWQSTQGDRLIMVVTIGATLFLPLQFAVLTGVLLSLVYYIWRTSLPHVYPVVPDPNFAHLVHQVDDQGQLRRPSCAQLAILEIRGDLYFGAAPHVEETILATRAANPWQRFLLLRMVSVDQIDISGIHMLENVVRNYRDQGGDVFLVRVQPPVFAFMRATGFVDLLGRDHLLDEDAAITQLFYRVLDPAVCIYECEVKVFKECQNLPKQTLPAGLTLRTDQPTVATPTVTPQALWEQMHSAAPPLICDVREPREFLRAHIPGAQMLPLPKVLAGPTDLPRDRRIVLTCRAGRRSLRAAQALAQQGYTSVTVLEGGLLAWEAASLLEAVDLKEEP
ncbi:MAG TPA: SulP family inorganic anion transporter [Anaerolineae bacterium]|nr:SulP family inorganic anion transporter [Anaerolineae bacterium]HNU03477.1 SulP family inorganic anion transporter [Anaerolineae bacterium]